MRPRPGVQVSEDWLFEDDGREVDGLPLTRPERSVTWEARRAPTLLAAVQAIDMAAFDDLVDIASLTDYVARLPSRPGVVRLRDALRWADENAWSPQEVTMRLCWLRERSGIELSTNLPIFDVGGDHCVTPDLLDVENGVAGEYDGAVHDGLPMRRRDLDRDASYRDLGIELVTMVSADRHDVTNFLHRLDAAYRRAARVAGEPRRWTTDQPSWWVDTSSVAARRRLDPLQRSVWLRRQRDDRGVDRRT